MTPEAVRKAQMQNDPSGLLSRAIAAEEDFYQTEGAIDLEQIQKEGAELDGPSQDSMEEVTSSYQPLAAQYNSVLDYDAHAGMCTCMERITKEKEKWRI